MFQFAVDSFADLQKSFLNCAPRHAGDGHRLHENPNLHLNAFARDFDLAEVDVLASFHFIQLASLHVVYETAHRDVLRNPRVVVYLPHLLADVFFKVIEAVEMSRLAGDRAHLLGEALSQLVFLNLQESAVGVVDDDELLCVEQVMRDEQRPDRVVRRDTTRVADHVSITGSKAKTMLEQNARVHASEYGGVSPWANLKIAQVETASENFVGS